MEHESEQSGGESDETCDVKMECPVCFSQFSPTDCRLKLLMCTHEICVGCVKKMDRCPICKEELSVVDLENAEFVARCGFSCSTCETRRTSDKMRICITCSETNGFLVETTKLKKCSDYIFCSECIIEDHIEQIHRQEKLMNYDVNYTAIKDMRRTCLIMKPILERVANGIEERDVKYKKLMKAMSLVLSADTDLHVLQLQSACAVIRKCIETVKEDSEIQRKYTSIWNDLYACLDEEIAQNIESEHEERKKSLEEIIRLQQEEAEKHQSDTIANKEMIKKMANENKGLTTRTKNLEEKIRAQQEENEQLRSEAVKHRETVENLESEHEDRKESLVEIIRSQQEIAEKLQSDAIANKEMIEKMANENKGLATKTKKSEEKIRSQQEENEQLRSEAVKHRETVEKMENENKGLATKTKKLEEKIRSQQEENEQLRSEAVKHREIVEKMANENKGLATKTTKLEEKIRAQQKENEQVRSEAVKHRETVEKTKKEIRQMSTQKNDFEQTIRSLKEEMKKIRSNVVTFAESLNDPPCLVRTPYRSSMCTMTPSSIHRLYFSVNKPMFLCRVGVHSSSEKTDAIFRLRITGPNEVDETVAKALPFHPPGSGFSSQTERLNKPVQIVPGCRYLIDLKVDKQVNVYSGQGGQRQYELPDYPGNTIDFSNCEGSETSIECGQFRGFYFVPSP